MWHSAEEILLKILAILQKNSLDERSDWGQSDSTMVHKGQAVVGIRIKSNRTLVHKSQSVADIRIKSDRTLGPKSQA